jgi:hypothetical protein
LREHPTAFRRIHKLAHSVSVHCRERTDPLAPFLVGQLTRTQLTRTRAFS